MRISIFMMEVVGAGNELFLLHFEIRRVLKYHSFDCMYSYMSYRWCISSRFIIALIHKTRNGSLRFTPVMECRSVMQIGTRQLRGFD